MNRSTRRDFLKDSASAAIGAAAWSALAPGFAFAENKYDGPNSPTVVAVYLRGGADALNSIVPFGDPTYYDIRPTISIPRETVKDTKGDIKGVLKIDNVFGFNPAMEPLMSVFQAGHLAPIVAVGSTHETRSHFDAQDFMERAAPGIKTITEGWLNRFLSATKHAKDHELRGLAFQTLLPRSLRGQYPVLAVPDDDQQQIMNLFEGLYTCEQQAMKKREEEPPPAKGQPTRFANQPIKRPVSQEEAHNQIVVAGANEIRRIREVKAILGQGRAGKYPQSRFGRQMQDIAQLIKANRGLEVAAIDYDGWDHHAYEGGSQGTISRMLGDLSAGLRGFYDDLGGDRMSRTLVLVMSEFGRTCKENGSAGSDHGHGGFMLAMGGMVKGKQVYGKWTGLEPENLNDRRDLPVHTDFRLVFAEALEMVFGFDTMKNKFFPEFKPTAKPLGYLNRVIPVG